MTAAPLNWIKGIHLALIEAKQIPLHGFSLAFPWEQFSQNIASLFQISELKISPRSPHFLTGHDITAGLGAGLVSIPLDMTPLSGQVFWIMGKEDIVKLTALVMAPTNGKGFSSPKFQEGFYYFLATKALTVLNDLQVFGDLSAKIGKASTIPQEESLCIDVEFQHPKQALWGRLVCPATFHQEFKAHFSTREITPLTSALAQQIDVPLSLEIGQTVLSFAAWKGVSVGDFILLDRCTFDPTLHKGTVKVMLEGTPLFRARIKENSLKIVDYAFYREEENPMSSNMPEDEENPKERFDTEEPAPLEETSEEGSGEEEHLWSSSQNAEKINEKMIATSEIPMTLTVEVARLRINLDKLLQLAPGNVLELPIRPEQGVDLTIAGKKVAKAELIKLGEMLGVKILQIGE